MTRTEVWVLTFIFTAVTFVGLAVVLLSDPKSDAWCSDQNGMLIRLHQGGIVCLRKEATIEKEPA